MTHYRFTNPWPDSGAPHGVRDLLRWRRERAANPPPEGPHRSVFERAEPHFHVPRAPRDLLDATWIGHSTVLVQMGGLNILTDPMWSERASPISWLGPRRWVPPGAAIRSLPPIDIVLISHNHYDHLDAGTVRAIARLHPHTHWLVPMGLARLVRRLGAHTISELGWWDETAIGDSHIACTPARHFSARGLTDRMRTLWCGWTVRAAGHSLYFAGDTAYHPEFGRIGERYGPFDISLLPIGAYDPRWFMHPMHMNPEEAVRAFLEVNGGARTDGGADATVGTRYRRRSPVMLGIHWGTFQLTDEPMDEPPRRTLAAWRAAGLPEENLWLLKHGETREAVAAPNA